MPESPKEHTWEHVDSVLQELGEIGTNIKAERAKRNQRILEIKDKSDAIIKKLERREAILFQVLQGFAEKHYSPHTLSVKTFKYGRIRIDNGVVEVELKTSMPIPAGKSPK